MSRRPLVMPGMGMGQPPMIQGPSHVSVSVFDMHLLAMIGANIASTLPLPKEGDNHPADTAMDISEDLLLAAFERSIKHDALHKRQLDPGCFYCKVVVLRNQYAELEKAQEPKVEPIENKRLIQPAGEV